MGVRQLGGYDEGRLELNGYGVTKTMRRRRMRRRRKSRRMRRRRNMHL